MSVELSGKPDAWKLARPVWGWGRGEIPRPTPRAEAVPGRHAGRGSTARQEIDNIDTVDGPW